MLFGVLYLSVREVVYISDALAWQQVVDKMQAVLLIQSFIVLLVIGLLKNEILQICFLVAAGLIVVLYSSPKEKQFCVQLEHDYIPNEPESTIDVLQCELAEREEKYKPQKNSTPGTPDATRLPEEKPWATPAKRKTLPHMQTRPKEYATLVGRADTQVKAAKDEAQEAVRVAEEQLQQAQDKIKTLEKQVRGSRIIESRSDQDQDTEQQSACANTTTILRKQIEDMQQEITSLRGTCTIQADDDRENYETESIGHLL